LEFNVPFQHKYGYIRDEYLDSEIQNVTRALQPVATCRQSPYGHKPAIAKLLLLTYGFKFRSAFLY